MNFNEIASKEFRNLVVFRELAKTEKDPRFQPILQELVEYEEEHFEFWKSLATKKHYDIRDASLYVYRVVRKLFGLTFTLQLLELTQGDISDEVRAYLFENDHPKRREMEHIVHVGEAQEAKLIRQIKEERVEFMGSIVLGLNDGLIELSGALTGFSFAFHNTPTVVLAGFILGISASLSMASSAYLQARQEKGKDPQKSAIYTGLAYIVVVLLLITPFILIPSIEIAILAMIMLVVLIVAGLSFYTSVIFRRKFSSSFTEMLIFSIGTALVTFLIGTAARKVFGIEI